MSDIEVTVLRWTPSADGAIVVGLSNSRAVTLTAEDIQVAAQMGQDLAAFAIFKAKQEQQEEAERAIATARARSAMGARR